jgi:pyruvate dehydrogenase E2 component (dihydrolipoamide acetyltransferase)
MPRLSDTMTEGRIGRWLKRPGDEVEVGEILIEIDGDKATIELESDSAGVLQEIRSDDGDTVAVGTVIGVVASSAPGTPLPTAAGDASANRSRPDGGTPTSSGLIVPPVSPRAEVRASPIARALATRHAIDLGTLQPGSGPEGRILKADVEHAAGAGTDPVAVGSNSDASSEPTARHRAMAETMSASKQEIPHFYVDLDVDMEAALAFLRDLRDLEPPVDVSLTTLVVASVARALSTVPTANAAFRAGRLLQPKSVNVGIAVALDDGGVIVAVVQDAGARELSDLALSVRSLTERARAGRLRPAEVAGSTFTVSNLGPMGVRSFHAIINPGESGILAVGAVEPRAVVVDGTLAVRRVATLSLSADHRVYAGAMAARFLQSVREGLEQPLWMALHPRRS